MVEEKGELGKRPYLGNGGDIIFVVAPSGGGKSTVIKHLERCATTSALPQRVIRDADNLVASVEQAEREGTGGFYRKPDGGFVVTKQTIVERAYRNFFSYISHQEYTGYPIIVEWSGGRRKSGITGEADVSYETIGKILIEYEQEIVPRVRAVLNLTTDRATRVKRNALRTGEEARGQTVNDIFYVNDFYKIAGKFPRRKVFPLRNQWGFLELELPQYPESKDFLNALYTPFISLATEVKLRKPRTEIEMYYGTKEDEFFNNYKQLKESYEILRKSQTLLKNGWTIAEIRRRMRSSSEEKTR